MDKLKIRTAADFMQSGEKVEILFWVGCAGSYDSRARRVSLAFSKILNAAGISFAILGNEEKCTGDPARRAGNEFLFQMMALQNIQSLKANQIQKIVTICPHCYNTLKNEYPKLGGHFDVIHHTQLIAQLLDDGRIEIRKDHFAAKRLSYHDSCYLGRINGEFQAPRKLLNELNFHIEELERSRANGLCCGAGGAQMFKEDEPGNKRINIERIDEILKEPVDIIAANCPYCITMLTDGLKAREKQDEVMVFDISELIVQANGL